MPRIEKYIYLRICVCGNIYTYISVCEINRMCVKERVGAIYVDTDASHMHDNLLVDVSTLGNRQQSAELFRIQIFHSYRLGAMQGAQSTILYHPQLTPERHVILSPQT